MDHARSAQLLPGSRLPRGRVPRAAPAPPAIAALPPAPGMLPRRLLPRRALAPLRRGLALAPPKASTGIVGLPVDARARDKLIDLYRETLELAPGLQAGLKDGVTKIAAYRLSVVERTTVPEEIEEDIDCGQIEELVEQATDELALVKHVIKLQAAKSAKP